MGAINLVSMAAYRKLCAFSGYFPRMGFVALQNAFFIGAQASSLRPILIS
jgi:hypothetical protein